MGPLRSACRSPLRSAIRTVEGLPEPLAYMPLANNLDIIGGTGTAAFARSTTKTYDRGGVVQTATIGEPAFETEGILLEGASTNLILRSEEFDKGIWSKLDGSSVAVDQAIAPDGSLTADRITFSASADSRVFQIVSGLTASNTYTYSCYARSETGDQVRRFGTNSFVAGEFIDVVVGAEWKRFEITVEASGTDERPRWSNTNNGEPGSILVWGAQLEELPLASSYIHTIASTVTRTQDDLSIVGANYNATQGTIYFESTALGFVQNGYELSANDGTLSNRMFVVFQIAGAIDLGIISGGSLIFIQTMGTYTPNSTDRIAVTYGPDGIEAYLNGVNTLSLGSQTLPVGVNTITIGNGAIGTTPSYGHMRNLRSYSEILTENQILSIGGGCAANQ